MNDLIREAYLLYHTSAVKKDNTIYSRIGHPSEIMDMSFASQLNAMIWMTKNGKGLKPAVYEFPEELDKSTAMTKLETMGISIDKWTPEQKAYARAYSEGK